MMLWICLWGAIPPALVAWWAYRQGVNSAKQSEEMAMKLRNEAMQSVEDLRKKIDSLAMPEHVRIAPEDMDALKQSLKGILGNFIKNGLAGANDFSEDQKKELVAQDPGAAILGAIVNRVLGAVGN